MGFIKIWKSQISNKSKIHSLIISLKFIDNWQNQENSKRNWPLWLPVWVFEHSVTMIVKLFVKIKFVIWSTCLRKIISWITGIWKKNKWCIKHLFFLICAINMYNNIFACRKAGFDNTFCNIKNSLFGTQIFYWTHIKLTRLGLKILSKNHR